MSSTDDTRNDQPDGDQLDSAAAAAVFADEMFEVLEHMVAAQRRFAQATLDEASRQAVERAAATRAQLADLTRAVEDELEDEELDELEELDDEDLKDADDLEDSDEVEDSDDVEGGDDVEASDEVEDTDEVDEADDVEGGDDVEDSDEVEDSGETDAGEARGQRWRRRPASAEPAPEGSGRSRAGRPRRRRTDA